MIWGWRLTRKPPHVESNEVESLHRLLKSEQENRAIDARLAKEKAVQLKIALSEAKKEEEERLKSQHNQGKASAIVHLTAAERYFESMSQSTGARESQLKALVDTRVEKAKNLGFELKGSITETLQALHSGR